MKPLGKRDQVTVELPGIDMAGPGQSLFGARDLDARHLEGRDMLSGGKKAPAIDYGTLKARWDVESLADTLRTGITPSGDAFGNTMGEVVLYGTQFLGEENLIAIATYPMDDHG